jgi:hypothetical protein
MNYIEVISEKSFDFVVEFVVVDDDGCFPFVRRYNPGVILL